MPEESSGQEQRDEARIGPAGTPLSPGEEPERVPTRKTGGPSGDKRDPRAKETALRRLHAASDEVLAVFEHNLRDSASAAGASEQEIRDAQAEHPEHT
jgi:hypothetical protein